MRQESIKGAFAAKESKNFGPFGLFLDTRPFRAALAAGLGYIQKGLVLGVAGGILMGGAGLFLGVAVEDFYPSGNPDLTIYNLAVNSGLVGFVTGFTVGLYEKYKASKIVRFP